MKPIYVMLKQTPSFFNEKEIDNLRWMGLSKLGLE